MNSFCVALTSLFDSEVLTGYNAKMDEAIAGLDIFGEPPDPVTAQAAAEASPSRVRHRGKRRSYSSKAAATAHTMRELQKLNSLMGGGMPGGI